MILALLIGTAVAGVFGILIGIPVLRLQGDYLAIVTLAFGEIIKNLLNAFYIGIDGSGLHISMKDANALNMDESGRVIIKGAQGITGVNRMSTFTIGFCPRADYACDRAEPHSARAPAARSCRSVTIELRQSPWASM